MRTNEPEQRQASHQIGLWARPKPKPVHLRPPRNSLDLHTQVARVIHTTCDHAIELIALTNTFAPSAEANTPSRSARPLLVEGAGHQLGWRLVHLIIIVIIVIIVIIMFFFAFFLVSLAFPTSSSSTWLSPRLQSGRCPHGRHQRRVETCVATSPLQVVLRIFVALSQTNLRTCVIV